jgi:hypothetical protein
MFNGLRILSFLVGGFFAVAVLIMNFVGGMVPNPDPHAGENTELFVVASVLALSAGFFFVGIFAKDLAFREKKRLRLLGMFLFVGPAYVFLVGPLFIARDLMFTFYCLPFSLVTWLIFSAFIWPGWLRRPQSITQVGPHER